MDFLPDHLLQQCVWRLPTPDQAVARCVCRRFRDLFAGPISFDFRARLQRLEPWLCVIGGIQEEKGELVAEMFDFRAQKWRPLPALPPNSSFDFSCAVIGLVKSHEIRLRSGEVYMPHRNVWCPIANMREGRSCCTSAVVGDKLYIIGGYGTLTMLQSVEVYDPEDDSWVQGASMPRLWFLAGCAAIGSKIYVIGSDLNVMDGKELAVFDTKLDTWSVVGSIPFNELVMRSHCSLWGCAVTSVGDKLYVLGGASSYDRGGLNTALVYDPVTEQWSTMREMRSSRHACGAVGINL
ncbi:hypothetical protein GOP47_0026813 [Adiantum capillus-veneris]|nr:hypothetical protein GOP47_0026813 [Adiantum capillus-veneris]